MIGIINKKGNISVNIVIAGVIALVILLIVLTGVWQKYSFFIWVVNLIPGFNQTIPEGTSIVGVNLASNKLMYFTGEKWKEIDIKQDNFVMGSYEFKPSDMKKAVEGFYFNTKRKPETLSLEVNHWRYLEAKQNLFNIKSYTKKGFEGPSKVQTSRILESYKNNFIPWNLWVQGEPYLLDFISFDLEKVPGFSNNVLAWRDSVLEENKCEKFIEFGGLKENEQNSEKKYTVKKLDQYIFVDLSKPVYEGKEEAYLNDDCFGFKNYEDKGTNIQKFPLTIEFKDGFLDDKLLSFVFNQDSGWSLPDSSYSSGIWPFNEKKFRYSITASLTKDISHGFYSIISTGKEYIKEFNVKLKDEVIYHKSSFSEIEIQNIDKIIYDILDEYNKNVVFVEEPAVSNPGGATK